MLAFILVLYCCILLKACYMSEKPIWPRVTRVEKEKKSGQRPRKRREKEEKNNKAEGLKEKNESTKCLSMPKA